VSKPQKNLSISRETGDHLSRLSARLTVENGGRLVSQAQTVARALVALEQALDDDRKRKRT
jgi:hypothetical protein